MSDDNGGFDYCDHKWRPILVDGKEIGKRCDKCNTTIGY